MTHLAILFAIVGTAAVSYLLTPLTIPLATRLGAIDIPGPRKVHSHPIGRLGGLAVVFAIALCYAVAFTTGWPMALTPIASLSRGLAAGLPAILIVSLIDDIRGVPALVKLMAHAVGAGVAVACGVELHPTAHFLGASVDLGRAVVPLSFLWIVGVTNAFNIIDGLDGLAAGLALISSGSLACVFLASGQSHLSFVSAVLMAALAGFLPFNLYPARVFLGDTGATAVGFVVACFALVGSTTLAAGFAIMLPVVMIGIPILDTLLAVLRRGMKWFSGDNAANVFQADAEHIHHRLLALGVKHRTAVLTLYGIAVAIAGLGLLSILMTAFQAGLLLTAIFVGTFVGVSRLGYEDLSFVRHGRVLRIYDIPLLKMGLFAVLVDFLFVATSMYVTIGLKFDDWALAELRPLFVTMTSIMMPSTFASFWAFGLYKGTWRFAGVHQFVKAAGAIVVASALGLFAGEVITGDAVHVSLFFIYTMMQLCVVVGFRASYLILSDRLGSQTTTGKPVLIYGAGISGARILRELHRNDLGLRPVGFIDDDRFLRRKEIDGVTVLGSVLTLAGAIERTGAHTLVVSSSSITRDRIDYAQEICRAMGVDIVRAEVRFESLELVETPEIAVV
jgi:UDP-GlcNAc:undecaprenyl-phosphate GlcNAc-1-phosphate transferase